MYFQRFELCCSKVVKNDQNPVMKGAKNQVVINKK